ncbi:U32 family peptidase [Halocella sp. SP3-1]|uniref:peptidase U32 family protein n=1 Tax=Halocella sp. SP3-1 TaxID=2382161 RepID=UPI000F7599CA|nr:U32 family peptidase [Halocella sp. SP3-1]AZO95701.1 U32 family peptidase [Halocella sp. SP3-1]
MKKPELLAPAGNLEKLKFAILYGADAVYCGGHNYGLREGADNFSLEELKEAVEFSHNNDSKIYVTVNMIPHNDDLIGIEEYLQQLEDIGVDALIISDPGILRILQLEGIEIPVHLSTQANAVNWASISFWQEQGVERIILARELSKDEIMEIRDKSSISLEMFIHGAMCISYSGRCLLSNYMANRDANRGRCAHSCRWQYYLMEEQRPGEYYPIYEDESGTHIMNSKDLCLINEIPDIIETGVDSLKIEGRMKSLHYVSTVTSVYRKALDTYLLDPQNYVFKEEWLAELRKVSHRDYTTGFFHRKPSAGDHNYQSSAYQRSYDFMGMVRQYLPEESEAVIEVRHKFFKGDLVEIMGPGLKSFLNKIDYIISEDGEMVNEAPHPKELIRIPVSRPVKPYYILRREKADE